MASIIDVNYNMEEYMAERQLQAQQQYLLVKYDRPNQKVWLYTTDGEGGSFNLFDFLCADDPRKFFVENF